MDRRRCTAVEMCMYAPVNVPCHRQISSPPLLLLATLSTHLSVVSKQLSTLCALLRHRPYVPQQSQNRHHLSSTPHHSSIVPYQRQTRTRLRMNTAWTDLTHLLQNKKRLAPPLKQQQQQRAAGGGSHAIMEHLTARTA